MCTLRSIRKRVRRAVARVALCGWILAFVMGVQGWSLGGSGLYAGAGRSMWSPCGSAMCACPPETLGVHTGHEPRVSTETLACCPLGEAAAGTEEIASTDTGFPLFVAFGHERRDESNTSPIPESLVLQLPPAVGKLGPVDTETGRLPVSAPRLASSATLEVPAPPPRA
ncbi:MAG: hypothetical protein ACF8R9_09065 [Phycisphaerales bacterium JB054]